MRLHFFNSAVTMNSKLDCCPFLENDLRWRLRHYFLLLVFFVARHLSKFCNKIVTEMLSWNLKYSSQQSLICLNEIILFSLFHFFFFFFLFFNFVNKGLKMGSVVTMKENTLKAWPCQCYFYFFHLTGLIMWFPAGVIPYLPYSKQSKMNKRGSIPSKLVASLMCRAGMVLQAILTCVIHYDLLPIVRAHCMSPVLKSSSVSCSLLLLWFFATIPDKTT